MSAISAQRLSHSRSRLAYAVLAAGLLAGVLVLVIGRGAAWWPALALAVAPDLALVYGIAPGLSSGQLHPRAVPLYNALHRFWGPLAFTAAAVAADLPAGWLAGALAWALHVAFDRAIGLRLRGIDGFQRPPQP